MTNKFDISVVVPLFNEEESLAELAAWVGRVLKREGLSGEIIFIDDGSSDGSWAVIEKLAGVTQVDSGDFDGEMAFNGAVGDVDEALMNANKELGVSIRGIRFRRNYGKSAALFCGFELAEGEVVITMDADLQDSPDEIPELRRMVLEQGFDLVSGWKKLRHDPLGKRLPSRLFNATARAMSGIGLHDFNCGLKAYRRKVVKSIEVYGEMHRYIPILAKDAGFRRIGEKVVEHYPRRHGVSKFGWERTIKGYLDLITVSFMTRFGTSPMYFFGTLGTLMFLVGGGTTTWLIVDKIRKQLGGLPVRGVTDQPLFYIALAAVVLGVMLFLAGFLGELIGRNSPVRNKYLIDEKI